MVRSTHNETGRLTKVADRQKIIILRVNGVAVARHGLILNHNEATSSRKVSRYLPGLRDAIKKSKMVAKVQKSKNPINYRIF